MLSWTQPGKHLTRSCSCSYVWCIWQARFSSSSRTKTKHVVFRLVAHQDQAGGPAHLHSGRQGEGPGAA